MQSVNQFINYVFDPLPPSTFFYLIPLIVFSVLFLAFSVFLRLRIKRAKDDKPFRRLFRAWPGRIETVTGILATYLLSRYFHIAFLSTRFLLFLILITSGYIIYRLLRAYLIEYPLEKKRHSLQMEKNKYMPGKKKK